MRYINLTGQKFGNLTVIKEGDRDVRGARRWVCVCDCGGRTLSYQNHLRGGKSKSCGCNPNRINKTHGESKTRLYTIWLNMKSRCDYVISESYKNYGGRGITYDTRWGKYEFFKEDMADGYSDDKTLERVDVNKGYGKDNCIWITKSQQARNKTRYRSNTSGYTGVSREGGEYPRWVSFWSDLDGKLRSKSFSVGKYGEEEAKNLAVRNRKEMMEELNKLGANYGVHHGK